MVPSIKVSDDPYNLYVTFWGFCGSKIHWIINTAKKHFNKKHFEKILSSVFLSSFFFQLGIINLSDFNFSKIYLENMEKKKSKSVF
jgi:hypothetical protein